MLDTQPTYPPFCPECTLFNFTVPNYHVPSDVTTYQCFGFELPTTDYHIIRFEAIRQNMQMVHHMLLYSSNTLAPASFPCSTMPGGTQPFWGKGITSFNLRISSGWAPGPLVLDVPSGAGFPIGPTPGRQYAVLQVHYNNPDKLTDQYDSSG